MTNEDILTILREERPNSVIHEVKSFNLNEYGFYDVEVDMEHMFFDTKILHTNQKLPYPYAEYDKLTNKQQLDWRMS